MPRRDDVFVFLCVTAALIIWAYIVYRTARGE